MMNTKVNANVQPNLSVVSSPNGKNVIEAQNLHVYYGDFRAIKHVNLQIERRKITAIIGPSGCGKSTIIIVTHNMQQAARVSDYTAFFMMDEDRAGMMVEYGPTEQIFTRPRDNRTEDYITGRFG